MRKKWQRSKPWMVQSGWDDKCESIKPGPAITPAGNPEAVETAEAKVAPIGINRNPFRLGT
jgi:hypothetical protein